MHFHHILHHNMHLAFAPNFHKLELQSNKYAPNLSIYIYIFNPIIYIYKKLMIFKLKKQQQFIYLVSYKKYDIQAKKQQQ